MKKIFLAVITASVLLLSGCSSDDDSGTETFESGITINGRPFSPSKGSEKWPTVITYFEIGINGGTENMRSFILMNNKESEKIDITLTYPATQSNINGTYSFGLTNTGAPGPLYFSNYSAKYNGVDVSTYNIVSGTVTITDLKDNRFKLEFNSALAQHNFYPDEKRTISGTFEGLFTLIGPEVKN